MTDRGTDSENLFIGVDVGGTNIKIGIANGDGEIQCEDHFPTEQEKGPKHSLHRSVDEVKALLDSASLSMDCVKAIGLGTPGTMDIPAGLILEPSNLPGWRNFNVRDCLSDAFDLPVTYTNDANAAAYGEFWAGGGAEFKSMALFTLGTGVGGGIIMDDYWIDGAHSHGAEVGHIVIDTSDEARMCGCGRRGHLEAYSSATAVVSRAQEAVATGIGTSLSQLDAITALEVSNAADAGDPVALELVMETADYLVRGISTLAHVIDPEAILLGGAMNFGGNETPLGRDFLARIVSGVAKWTFPIVANNLTINFATLGSAAGWVGAAGLSHVEYTKRNAS